MGCWLVFVLFIYFLAKGDQKQKLSAKSRDYFIVKDQSFKKRVTKI